MNEMTVMVMLGLSPILFMLGGYRWKWLRRFVLPALYLSVCLFSGVLWWKAVLCGLAAVAVNCLGYGESIHWSVRTPVFIALASPALVINWNLWWLVLLFGAVGETSLFYLSRKFQWFTWKIWEAVSGLGQATLIVCAILAK